MSKFVVVVFPDEAKAYQGTRALRELHSEGSLTLYGAAAVAKDKNGQIKVIEGVDAGPLGVTVGAVVGGLIGVLGGPVGAIAGMAGGALIGSMGDLLNLGAGADFLTKISAELAPGKTAIVAEVDENWITPMDVRMAALGGTVLRTWRADFEDAQIEKEIDAAKAEYEQLKSEYARAKDEAKAAIKAKLAETKAQLDQRQAQAVALLATIDGEMKAKIDALGKQAVDAGSEAKAKIDRRITTLRGEYEKRSAKLRQAMALAREAIAA